MRKEYSFLDSLQPQAFFHWFGEISAIPRGSGKEQKFAAFLMDFAQRRSYPCEKDVKGNVFMDIPATEGYEKEPSILFQAHMDMVWEQRKNMDFKFETQPLNLALEGDKLTASGTTLGADNGVGLATMLALADTTQFPHPPLEFLFTVEEETGLYGIRSFDMSRIHSRRMINMDCGYSDMFCVSTAGAIETSMEKTYLLESLPADTVSYRISISGGRGGHSGITIHRGRMCAANALGALLRSAGNVRLSSLKSGSKCIIREGEAVVSFSSAAAEHALQRMKDFFNQYRIAFEREDPDICFTAEPVDSVSFALSEEDSADICSLMSIFHTGPYRMDPDIRDYVITSASVEDFSLADGKFKLGYNIRSCNDAIAEICYENYRAIAQKFGLMLTVYDRYSGWPEHIKSAFRDQFISTYKAHTGKEPGYERVHGGVEIGNIAGAIPDMDGVGYAPSSHGAHTSEEYLEVSQAQIYWDVLTDVLGQKQQNE